jgi:hypothetical protein
MTRLLEKRRINQLQLQRTSSPIIGEPPARQTGESLSYSQFCILIFVPAPWGTSWKARRSSGIGYLSMRHLPDLTEVFTDFGGFPLLIGGEIVLSPGIRQMASQQVLGWRTIPSDMVEDSQSHTL